MNVWLVNNELKRMWKENAMAYRAMYCTVKIRQKTSATRVNVLDKIRAEDHSNTTIQRSVIWLTAVGLHGCGARCRKLCTRNVTISTRNINKELRKHLIL
jgi:hypothetical protein